MRLGRVYSYLILMAWLLFCACGDDTSAGVDAAVTSSDGGIAGCIPKPAVIACTTNVCGTAPDGCNGSVNCGVCSATYPMCQQTKCCKNSSTLCCKPKTQAQACGTAVCGSALTGCTDGRVTCGDCPIDYPVCKTTRCCKAGGTPCVTKGL